MNGLKYEEINDEKDASEDVEFLNLEVDALIEARQLSIEQLESISAVLFGVDISKISTAEMKRDILVYARNYPEEFLDVVRDPELKLQSKVMRMFDKGIIQFRKNQKEVWYNTTTNKKKLLTVPFGEDGYFTVATYFKSDEGVEALKVLEKLL